MTNDTMTNAAITTEPKYEKLGWKTFWIFVSEKSAFAIAVGLVAVGAGVWSNLTPLRYISQFAGLLFIVVVLVTLVISYSEYVRYEFLLDTDALRIRRGVMNREEIAIPYRQIQNVDIERPMLFQLTGVSKLAILTAGHTDSDSEAAHSEGVIPVIDQSLARRLQTELLTKANIQKTVAV